MAGISHEARDLSERLTARAEQVCRHYLPQGRREGRYWMVGDVAGTPGRSLFVRLSASPAARGAAGKWIDAATGEHGDLLDLIAANRTLRRLREVLDEARSFLALPPPPPEPPVQFVGRHALPSARARRLFARGRPIAGTLAENYLASRGLAGPWDFAALRFHPNCWHWRGQDLPRDEWPALLAAITDNQGAITAVHRTWLARDGSDKAPLETPRRAMGAVLGHAVRFGVMQDTMIAGEGIETMLSLHMALPAMPMAACTSANHLALFEPPSSLTRLYVARDRDPAGVMAFDSLTARLTCEGIEVLPLDPIEDDFNGDLMRHGIDKLKAALLPQLDPRDLESFVEPG
ncbi:MAG: toprim domain-containing protein [Novosphingobium sp.]|nr:toprim domain-containing protein [Novosphingobium sp.]